MTTLTVYADASDGYLYSNGATYALTRSGAGVQVNTTLTTVPPGQSYDSYGAGWEVYEAFESFDTSSIGAGATVTSTVLTVTSDQTYSDTAFSFEARLKDWGATLDAADWVAGASLSGLTLLAHYALGGGFVFGTAYNFIDDAFPANVNKTGSTRIIVCSSRTTSGTAPVGDPSYEYAFYRSADYTGTTSDPKLVVVYTASSGVTVSPVAASLATTASAPAVTAGGSQSRQPDAAALTLTTSAPTVALSAHVTATPLPAALSLAAEAPLVAFSDNKTALPVAAGLVMTAFAPNVVASDSKLAMPAAAALRLTASVPSVAVEAAGWTVAVLAMQQGRSSIHHRRA